MANNPDHIIDPMSGNTVRPTDNSAKTEHGDYYPKWQESGDIYLDPRGFPYNQKSPVPRYDIGVSDDHSE